MWVIVAAILIFLGFLLTFCTALNILSSPKCHLGWLGLSLWCLGVFILLVSGMDGAIMHGGS
jgi:hypothetical protein